MASERADLDRLIENLLDRLFCAQKQLRAQAKGLRRLNRRAKNLSKSIPVVAEQARQQERQRCAAIAWRHHREANERQEAEGVEYTGRILVSMRIASEIECPASALIQEPRPLSAQEREAASEVADRIRARGNHDEQGGDHG